MDQFVSLAFRLISYWQTTYLATSMDWPAHWGEWPTRKESLFLLCTGGRTGFFGWAKRSYLTKEVSHGVSPQIVPISLLTEGYILSGAQNFIPKTKSNLMDANHNESLAEQRTSKGYEQTKPGG